MVEGKCGSQHSLHQTGKALLREGTYDVWGKHSGKEDGSGADAGSYVC